MLDTFKIFTSADYLSQVVGISHSIVYDRFHRSQRDSAEKQHKGCLLFGGEIFMSEDV